MGYFPAFLELQEKRAVVVGGGKVAERKVRSLVKAGAQVLVISPELSPGLRKLVGRGAVSHRNRTYRKGDLAGAFLVIAATDDGRVNARVSRDAPGLVNVVDAPEDSNFIVPATFSRGDLQIAVSTSGTSPAMAAAIRNELREHYGPEFAEYLKEIKRRRAQVLAEEKDSNKRSKLLRALGGDAALRDIRRKGNARD